MSYRKQLLALITTIGTILNTSNIHAQVNRKIDSLQNVLADMREDSIRVKTLNELSQEYQLITKYLESIEMAKQSLLLAQKLQYARGLANAYSSIGFAYSELANYPKALDYYLKALSIAERINTAKLTYKCYNGIGNIYYSQKKYDIAYNYFRKALQQAHVLKDQEGLSATYSNIGNIETACKNYNLAIINFEKSLYIDYDLGAKEGVATNYVNIGNIYSYTGNYQQAISNNEKALNIFKTLNSKWGMAICFRNMGSGYKNLKRYDQALQYIEQSIKVAQEIHMTEVLLTSYNEMSEVYAANKDFKQAYLYHVKTKQLNDSIFNMENSKQLSELTTRYEVDKKEAEINQKIVTDQKRRKIYAALAALNTLLLIVIIIVIYQRRIAKKEKETFRAIISSQEAERERIGRDLHDDVGPLLSAVKLMLEGFNDKHGANNNALLEDVQYAGGILDKAIRGVRTSSHNLTPSVLTNMGLIAAIEELANDINRASIVKVEYSYNYWPEKMMPSVAINVYRIIQELLNNCLKHAKADNIWVKLYTAENNIDIEVADNGEGFDIQSVKALQGIGMKNIAGRVTLLQGTLNIQSQLSKGTQIHIQLDIENLSLKT